jgi:hypothetical protein
MKPRRLLYLSAHQLSAFRWQAGSLLGEAHFEANSEGYQQFADYLQQHRTSLFSLLVNVAEEGFQIETIPFLRGADRQAILDRKFNQLFFNAPLKASFSLGHEKSQRKNERVMLTALTNKDFFKPWLQTIGDAQIALAGIYSLPLLGASLLKKMGIVEERCLLLTVQDQSIRQSYLEKGEVHFSRLTTLHNNSVAGIAQAFASEAVKLQQYLASQRLIGRTQAIAAYILAHPSALKIIETSCIDTDTLNYNILNLEDCAARTGLKTQPTDTHCELLFLHLLASAPPSNQFADDVQRHDYHLGKIRTALYGASSIALLAGLGFSGHQLYETWRINQESETLKAEAQIAQHRYDDIVKTFPPIPTDNQTLRRIIDRYTELNKKNATPEGLYQVISDALQTRPALELESIDWKVGSTTGNTNASPASGITIADNNESTVIRGTVKLATKANPRQTLAIFQGLVDSLRANPTLQIKVLQQPFNVESGKALKGDDITPEDDKPRTFSIQITRKIVAS